MIYYRDIQRQGGGSGWSCPRSKVQENPEPGFQPQEKKQDPD